MKGTLAVSFDVSAVPAKLGGVGRFVSGLLGAINNQTDLSLTLISRTGDIERWHEIAPRATIKDLAPNTRPLRIAWEQARLPKILDSLGVDLHHGPHYTFPQSATTPSIVTIHDVTYFSNPTWHQMSKVQFFRRAIKTATRLAAGVICDSETTRAKLLERFSVSGKVFVIPLGVDHKRFNSDGRDSQDDANALAQLGIGYPYVLYLGTVEPRKDVPTLVRAFDKISQGHKQLHLVIAGAPGWGERELATAIGQVKHRDKIIRLGYVPDESVPALVRGAKAVAYPSIEEGFGLPVLEALACATPVITTSGTAMEEVGKGAAVIVSPGDDRGLAGALDMVAREDDSLSTRKLKGLEIAGRFTWENACEKHIEAYRAVVDRVIGP